MDINPSLLLNLEEPLDPDVMDDMVFQMNLWDEYNYGLTMEDILRDESK